mgnify:FL=1
MQGLKGDTGATGATGPKGDTGTSSSSSITHGIITFPSINNVASPGSTDATFGNFSSGKSYWVKLKINAGNSNADTCPLKLTITTTPSGITLPVYYVTSSGPSGRNSSDSSESFISADIIINGGGTVPSSITAREIGRAHV